MFKGFKEVNFHLLILIFLLLVKEVKVIYYLDVEGVLIDLFILY